MSPIILPDRIWHSAWDGELIDLLMIGAVVGIALWWVLRRIDQKARRDGDRRRPP
jgi:hypothetical protein